MAMGSNWLRSALPALAFRGSKLPWKLLRRGAAVTGGATLLYLISKENETTPVAKLFNRLPVVVHAAKVAEKAPASQNSTSSDAAEQPKKDAPIENVNKKAIRGKRMRKKFLSYASVVYDGNAYMTTEDFMLALLEAPSRLSDGRTPRQLTKDDLKTILKAVPDLKKGTKTMFRSLGANGLISFPEFVFLLCALTRSERGFKIGFLMLDENGNGKIDLKEFTRLTDLVGHAYAGDILDDPEVAESAPNTPATTLTVHLFGQNGRGILPYDQFKTFVDNLWLEMVEAEFDRMANPVTKDLSVEDFGRIVLRYTHLDDLEQKNYLTRLCSKSKERVNFEEFRQFNQFLSHLDDFRLAMRMYSISSVSVSQDELARAILVSSGVRLSSGLLELIYAVFDMDGDAKLSYREFVSVLHDRLNRSLRSETTVESDRPTMWAQWKKCVRQEFRRTV